MIGLLAAALAVPLVASQAAVRFRVELPKSFYVGDVVQLSLLIENVSSQPVDIDLGWDRVGALTFDIADPRGTHQRVRSTAREGLSSHPIVHLGPGEKYEQSIILNEWFSFARVGAYSVRVELDKSAGRLLSLPIEFVAPQVVQFRILARDEEALRARANQLMALILPRSPKFIEAARALSYMSDPLLAAAAKYTLTTIKR